MGSSSTGQEKLEVNGRGLSAAVDLRMMRLLMMVMIKLQEEWAHTFFGPHQDKVEETPESMSTRSRKLKVRHAAVNGAALAAMQPSVRVADQSTLGYRQMTSQAIHVSCLMLSISKLSSKLASTAICVYGLNYKA